MKLFQAGIISLLFSIGFAPVVYAVELPQFPTCLNPQGQIIASYSSGAHGIVGNTGTFTGKDTVYQVSDNLATQCFCPENGSTGIQTDWMKAVDFSEDTIQILEKEGWVYIPTGSIWGLSDVPYLAKNSSFACSGPTGGQNSSSTSSNTNAVGGASATNNPSVQATLSLATTGNLHFIFSLLGIGILSFVFGIYLRKTAK